MASEPTDPSPARVAAVAAAGGRRTRGRGGRARRRRILGLTPRRFAATVVLPLACVAIVAASLALAEPGDRPLVLLASLVAAASGLAATSIGVYGGVLVPGLLLLGVDPRFAAAASLFLQVLVIPVGAGAHYRLGNISRRVALPLIAGGMTGAFVGPFFAVALPGEVIARLVAGMIVLVGLVVLATLHWSGLGVTRASGDVPSGRVAGVGLVAGFSSGVSGAGWGPIGVKLLILLRIEPKAAIGSSLLGRAFMASAAVVAYLVSATAFRGFDADLWLLVPLFAGSIAAMVPGALLVSRLGRERATVVITLLSILLAVPTLIWG
jgi:uncharacterized protein